MFRRSSYCDSSACLEVGFRKATCDAVLIRDSKDQDGPLLRYTRLAWAEFLAGAKAGEFELPVA